MPQICTTLEWRDGISFVDMVTQTSEIVSRLQADGRLLKPSAQIGQPADVDSSAPSPPKVAVRSPGVARHEGRGTGPQAGGVHKVKEVAKPSHKELRELAERYDCCYDCGEYCPPGTLAEHRHICPKRKDLFATRLGRVRGWVKKGITDYNKINNFGTTPDASGKGPGAGPSAGAGGPKPHA
jgi:hypothetical protein